MDNQISDFVFETTLAALLHDIGKVYQRMDKGDRAKLPSSILGMRGQVGTIDAGYDHALWTLRFLEEMRPTLHSFISNSTDFENSAGLHHNPMQGHIEQWIVTYADRASAGMNRYKPRPGEHKEQKNKRGFLYYQRPLSSLFSQVTIEEKTTEGHGQFYLPSTLYDMDALFGQPEENSIEYKYPGIMQGFIDDFRKIDTKDRNHFLETIASLLFRWFWAVPSSTMEPVADIPLCDHLTSTAALAACMAAQTEQQQDFNPAESTFLWVSGDVGGIQNFIFALEGENKSSAARLLRGRSFFVSLLSRLCADHCAGAAGVPTLCRIMDAGGRFTILLPDTEKSRAAIQKTRIQLQDWLLNSFFGQLFVYIDNGVECKLQDFQLDCFLELLARSSESVAIEKSRPFASTLKSGDNRWMADNSTYKEYMEHGLCPLCSREPATGTINDRRPGANCTKFINWGGQLPSAEYLTIQQKEGPDSILGAYNIVFDEIKSGGCTFSINQHLSMSSHAMAEIHYSCHKPDVEEDDGKDGTAKMPLSLDKIADKSEGIHALAMLKADVDNMGYIMSYGFGKRNSLARQAGISRMLNYFFAGFLPKLLKNFYPNTYTLFAGGDDLCLIGPWSDMVKLAPEINKQFRRYVGNGDIMTLSAAVHLFHKKYPLTRAVEEAEESLKKAKNGGRNRLHLFDREMLWDSEALQQYEFSENWKEYVIASHNREEGQDQKMHTMLYRFLRYHLDAEEFRKKKDVLRAMRYKFQYIYDIKRNVEREWWDKEPFKSLLATSEHEPAVISFFDNLCVGISIAMYKQRKGGGTDG